MDNKIEPRISEEIKAGIRDGIAPSLVSIPIGLTFGIVAQNVGLSFWQTASFAAVVVAAASQLAVLDLMTHGSGLLQIFTVAALINFRFSFLSATISRYLRRTKKVWFPFLAFGIVTPTLGPIVARGEKYSKIETYIICLHIMFIVSWILGSITGYLLPGILPPAWQVAISFAFPALLIGMIINSIPFSGPISEGATGLFVVFIAGVSALALYFISPVWSVPTGAVIGATLGTLVKWRQK